MKLLQDLFKLHESDFDHWMDKQQPLPDPNAPKVPDYDKFREACDKATDYISEDGYDDGGYYGAAGHHDGDEEPYEHDNGVFNVKAGTDDNYFNPETGEYIVNVEFDYEHEGKHGGYSVTDHEFTYVKVKPDGTAEQINEIPDGFEALSEKFLEQEEWSGDEWMDEPPNKVTEDEAWKRNNAQAYLSDAKKQVALAMNIIAHNVQDIERYIEDHAKSMEKFHELHNHITQTYDILNELSQ